VLAAWVALVLIGTALNTAFGERFHDELERPGSESQEAFTLLDGAGFAHLAGVAGHVGFEAPGGVRDPEVRSTCRSCSPASSSGERRRRPRAGGS
jgi:hypothetical protein